MAKIVRISKWVAGLSLVVGLVGIAGAAGASASTTSTETCSTSKVAVTHLVKVQRREHGKLVTVKVRRDVKVKEHVKEKVRVKVDGKFRTETKTVIKLVVKYRSVTSCAPVVVTVNTPASIATSSVPSAPSTPAPAPVQVVAIDPICAAETNPLVQDCTFSVSDVSSGGTPLSGGVLQFATTMTPNDQSASLITPATPGCTLNVSSNATSSTCTVTYPSAGTYYVETIYDGGPSAYSASEAQAITVTVPQPPPVLMTTAALSVGAEDNHGNTPVGATITDQNGNAVTTGSVSYQLAFTVALEFGNSTYTVAPIVGPVGTTCVINLSEVGNLTNDLVVSSTNCSGGGTVVWPTGGMLRSIWVEGTYSGATYDSPTSAGAYYWQP